MKQRDDKWRREMESISENHATRLRAMEDASPPNFVHALASLEERLTRALGAVEARVVVLEALATPGPAEYPLPPEAPVRFPPPPHPGEHPPGVVSPHVRRNLDVLAAWTQPDRWHVEGTPAEQHRMRALLEHLSGLVALAARGEDVPRPGE